MHQMHRALFHTNSETAHVKQCALILVDEIIESYEWEYLKSGLDFWQEVKQEVENL